MGSIFVKPCSYDFPCANTLGMEGGEGYCEGFSLGCFSQGKVTTFPCTRALLALALTIGTGDDNLFPYRMTSRLGKGGVFFSPRRLMVSRVRDAMDASSQTRHFASHIAPMFQQDAPLLASLQRNAPLQQPLVPSQQEHSQREGDAPL
ncbi:hypothetical protein B296_00059098 [Ensete ventricosum]|uniref:Uncharacterized protein n=1 Tax=Ensete ventricosum TaxID=4639 RepID=A0A426WYP8_ENSVE|nr:hypothetical protein B296_00059098 [Ensete ventricosum]